MDTTPPLPEYLRVVDRGPDAVRAYCPLHDDRAGVLALSRGATDWRWHCPTCGTGGSLRLAWLLWQYADVPRRFLTDLTLDRLTREKLLPLEFLKEIGLINLRDRLGVGIPYRNQHGHVRLVKRRWRVSASKGSSWPARTYIDVYGQERLAKAQTDGRLFLVNGESDAWTAWHHSLPALALPGDYGVKALMAHHLDSIHNIFLCPHRSDFTYFADLVRCRLKELRWPGTLCVLRSPVGNDLNALHRHAPERFAARIERMMRDARPE